MAGPLSGLTVVDLTRVLSGPYCTMLLGDMGARVIKIEQPGRGDETRTWGPPFVGAESTYFLSLNRNKESVTVDFKKREGRAVLERLLDRADVVIENFRPGTLERFALDAESVRGQRPRVIYCSISGYGQTGPRRVEAGYDAVIQAEGGLMSVTGNESGPPLRAGVPVADLVTGLMATQGVLLALYARERTGRGQHVDISMFDSTISILTYHASAWLNAGVQARRLGNRHPTVAPYDTFAAADGDIFIAIGNDDQFRRFCATAQLEHLLSDARFNSNPARVVNHAALREALAAALRRQPRAHWVAALKKAGVPCGEVRDIHEALDDPQVEARRMIQAVEHATAGVLSLPGVPIALSDTPGAIRRAPPTLGQHTDAVLGELGFGADAIGQLRAGGII